MIILKLACGENGRPERFKAPLGALRNMQGDISLILELLAYVISIELVGLNCQFLNTRDRRFVKWILMERFSILTSGKGGRNLYQASRYTRYEICRPNSKTCEVTIWLEIGNEIVV